MVAMTDENGDCGIKNKKEPVIRVRMLLMICINIWWDFVMVGIYRQAIIFVIIITIIIIFTDNQERRRILRQGRKGCNAQSTNEVEY